VYAIGTSAMRPRTIILAPDSFKETLPAAEVAAAMAEGIARVSDSMIARQCRIGDGGEGTMEAIISARGGHFMTVDATGPRRERMRARFGRINDGTTGIVELAQASGLALVPPSQRDPMGTTTYGTGRLIAEAVRIGCREVIVCIGGSATVDGGAGIAQACGWHFLDHQGKELRLMSGGALARIARIEPPQRGVDDLMFADRGPPRVRVACDVVNPLCGPNGAAAVYGPQKGATPEQVRLLDEGLGHLAKAAGGDPNAPGAGAAGGAGYGLATFLNATLERGIDLVLEMVRFDETCRGADLVITGEGRLDAQSLQGKACLGVAAAAGRLGVPTIAIVGTTGPGAEKCIGPEGLSAYHSLADRFGEDRARREARTLIADLTEAVVRGLS